MSDFYDLLYGAIFVGLVFLVAYVSYLDLRKRGKTKYASLKLVGGVSIGLFLLAWAFLSTEYGRSANELAFKSLVNIFFPGALN